jgi:hypothetical protein
MPADDAPPVTFGVKVTKDIGHVHFDLFAGTTPDARGRAGSLVMRPDEFEAFVRRLGPETIAYPSSPGIGRGTGVEWQLDAKPECICDLHETGTIFGPPEYTRGRSNGCLIHPASEFERKQVEAQRLREAEFERLDAEA